MIDPRLRALGLAVALVACQREGADAGEHQQPAAVQVRAAVILAPVADDHPYVIALLTALAGDPPADVVARLEGRTEAGGRRIAEPLLYAERRELLVAALAAYEREHPHPPELMPVWEQVAALDGDGAGTGWQLHFIEFGPKPGSDGGSFTLDAGAKAQLVQHSLGSVVEIELSSAQREQFAKLTQAELGHRVAIVIDDEAVAVPIVREPILGGRVQVWPGPGERHEAATQALLDRLGGG